ncbi:MAG: transcriptional repressor [Spirochaetes bacterium]|nr:transcriptional repressor [Spirochaetota bacterium]
MDTQAIFEYSLLQKYEIKPSVQRLAILKYFILKRNHPTIEEIFNELEKQIPTLSKTTIYNTLKIFIEKGLAISFINGDKTVYDLNYIPHLHFKCIKCDKLYDIEDKLVVDKFKIDFIDGNKVISNIVIFEGVCKNCIN